MGATGPATLAGTVVANFAELFSILVLIQFLKPGTRVHIASDTYPQNMRSGAPRFGQITCSLIKAAENQMSRHYGIPRRDSNPGPLNSKKTDFQAGYERGLNGLASALSGSSLISMHSALYGEMAAHPIQAILDDDIAGMIGRFLEGVTVTDDTLAIELIEQVGPIPGNYLNTAHTREWWRREEFIPAAADDLTYPEWFKSGKKDCLDYAQQRLQDILSSHKVSSPLTGNQEAELGRILTEAREYYQSRGQISDEESETYEKLLKMPDYPFA